MTHTHTKHSHNTHTHNTHTLTHNTQTHTTHNTHTHTHTHTNTHTQHTHTNTQHSHTQHSHTKHSHTHTQHSHTHTHTHTQHSHGTNIHEPGGFRTRNPSNRAAEDVRQSNDYVGSTTDTTQQTNICLGIHRRTCVATFNPICPSRLLPTKGLLSLSLHIVGDVTVT
jgi:hypothetical protein